MTSVYALLALQQISDSLFPSGMFTHSFGLEQLVREGAIRTADDVERFVVSTIKMSVSRSDAVAAAAATRAANAGDLPALVVLDRELFAMKSGAELRRASTNTGRRLLEEVAAHNPDPAVHILLGEVRAGGTPGTNAVAFGAIAAAFGAGPADAAALVMQGPANVILQAAMRLFPMSHRDVQGALHRMRPQLAELARRAAEPGRQLESFHPLQDIASMRHERASVRMFAS